MLRNLEGTHDTRKCPPSTEFVNAAVSKCADNTGSQDYTQASVSKLRPRLLVWSAAESDGLMRLYTAYLVHLRTLSSYKTDSDYFADFAWTLSEKRSRLPWKSFVVANSVTNLQRILENATPNGVRSNKTPRIGFVFTGQGAQWYGMGRELLDYPVFRASLENADSFLRDLGCSWSLLSMAISPV